MKKVLTIKAISFGSEEPIAKKMALINDPDGITLRKLIDVKIKEAVPSFIFSAADHITGVVTATDQTDVADLLDSPVSLLLDHLESCPKIDVTINNVALPSSAGRDKIVLPLRAMTTASSPPPSDAATASPASPPPPAETESEGTMIRGPPPREEATTIAHHRKADPRDDDDDDGGGTREANGRQSAGCKTPSTAEASERRLPKERIATRSPPMFGEGSAVASEEGEISDAALPPSGSIVPSSGGCNDNGEGGGGLLFGLLLRTNPGWPRPDSSVLWDFLAVRDLYRLRSVSRSTLSALRSAEYNRCHDGKDYLVPFPAFPAVLDTPEDVQNGAGLFAHQLASLGAMIRAENTRKEFGALRGGILGDAPGLGKTITMLALIANTSGLRPVEPKEFYDDASIDEHWKTMRTNPCFRLDILRALRPFRGAGIYSSLAEDVSPPFADDRFPTLASFERHVNRTMMRAASQSQLDLFRRNVIAFKAGLDKRNRRFFSNEKGKRMVFERNLLPCSTTLVVVPDALLEHWAEQIRRHVNLPVFADFEGSSGVVYIDGVGDLSTARFPLNHSQMPIPSAFDLIGYMIVVVPFSRIKQQHSIARKRQREENATNDHGSSEAYASSSPLLQLRWFRIVVDEGHELGENDAGSDVTRFVNCMGAERRWAMSGTPTTGDEDDANFTARGLDQLQRLLLFLRHERYGTVPEPSRTVVRGRGDKHRARCAWAANVKIPFLRKQHEGREELYRVLDEVMVMHKKEDIGLPKPIFKQSEVSVRVPSEIQSAMIDAVLSDDADCASTLSKIGLLHRRQRLADAYVAGGSTLFDALVSEYLSTDDFQNRLDDAQAKFIVNTVKRERLELEERGGAILGGVTAITAATDSAMSSETWVDRRPVKAVVYSSSHNSLLDVAEYLYDSFESESIAEMMEGKIELMSYELGRFRNNCKEGKICPICGGYNEYVGKKLTRCSNRLVEVSDREGNTYLIEPDRIIRAVGQAEFSSLNDRTLGNPVGSTRLQGAPLTKYGLSQKHWKVDDCLCIDVRDPHPLLQKRWSEEQWAAYGSATCRELAESDGHEGGDNYLGRLPTGEERASREVMVKLRKWQPCGRFHSRPRWDARRKKSVGWYTGPTLEDVKMLTQKEDTFILLLDASLSHGLDLSFVTHMFLLEPINDAAHMEQVTSRAHRLGCTGPVTIETIHTWHQLDSETKQVARQVASTIQDATKETSRAVCDHCYRSFENIAKAKQHELTCDRNPNGNAIVDPFHLPSVYRDIRPPAPVIVGLPDTTMECGVIGSLQSK